MSGPAQLTLDTLLQLKDAGAITASAACQVGGSAKVLDMGSNAQFEGDVVIDVSAIDVASGDELYTVIIEGSSSSTFASVIQELGCARLGKGSVKAGGSDVDDGTGRYVIPVSNERNGTRYRYIRAYLLIVGTTPSINAIINLTKPRRFTS